MTPFRIVNDQVVVPEGSHKGVKGRIERSLEFAPGYHCGVQFEPIASEPYLRVLEWLREKDFQSVLVDDFDTLFFAYEADLTFFLLTWADRHTG